MAPLHLRARVNLVECRGDATNARRHRRRVRRCVRRLRRSQAVWARGLGELAGAGLAACEGRDDRARADAQGSSQAGTSVTFASSNKLQPGVIVFLLLLIAGLLVGTLRIDLLTDTYANMTLPLRGAAG